jgi:hypothetical protein
MPSGRKGIAEDWVQQAHVQIARGLGLPAGMGKVFERAGDLQCSLVLDVGPLEVMRRERR